MTRKQKALELLQLANDGPCFERDSTCPPEKLYRIWSQSWLIPLLRKLVPELREKHKAKEV